MSTSAISQFCQQIPFCEGAKTVLTANPKVTLLAAIGVVGITLIAHRVLRAAPSANEEGPQRRILTRTDSVITYDVSADPSAGSMEQPDPVEEPTGTVLFDGKPLAESMEPPDPEEGPSGTVLFDGHPLERGEIIHIPSDDPVEEASGNMVIHPSAKSKPRLIVAPGKYSGLKKRPPPLDRSRFSTELIGDIAQRAGPSGFLVKSGALFDLRYPNATLDFRFFQNSHPCKIEIDGCTFQSARVAILAMQFPTHKKEFERYDSSRAIIAAKDENNTTLRLSTKDWAKVQDREMHRVLFAKFSTAYFKDKLLATKNAPLTYEFSEKEGFQDDEIQNKGGKALMQIRGELGGTGIVERGEIPPPLEEPSPPPAPKPILKSPGVNPSTARRFAHFITRKK